MVIATRHFRAVADKVTEQIAGLLCAPVTIVDERGDIIASSQGGVDGGAHARAAETASAASLRVPIQLDGHTAMVVTELARGEVISPRLAQALVELAINQAAFIEYLPNHEELKSAFVHDLLSGAAGDDAELLREGHILGMDLSRHRSVILIDAAEYILAPANGEAELDEAQIWRRARIVITSIVSFFHLPTDSICAYIGGGEVVILKAITTTDLVEWTGQDETTPQSNPSWANLSALKRACRALLPRLCRDTGATIRIGIGRHHPGLRGLMPSYHDARAALGLGRRFPREDAVYCLDDLGVAAFIGVADEGTKIDLARHLLSPLDHEPELLETLDAFFAENCCPSSTASRLGIHRNTLSYRLDKIASLTGLDARRFDDAIQIRLALLLRALPEPGS